MGMSPLDGIVVLDLSTEASGRFCARVLHDFGATVYRPAGLAPRLPELSAEDRQRAEIQARAEELFLDAGKRPLRLALEGSGLADACRNADIVVETFAPGELDRRGVDTDSLAGAGSVLVSITPFGQDGPRAGWQ